MSFYNHRTSISNTTNSISPFYFDKIYTSRVAMDLACESDGVYLGRFVLIRYDDGSGIDVNENNNVYSQSIGTNWTNNFWNDALEYWGFDTKGGDPGVNVLGYDGTVWQKNLVNGQMKYVMVASLYGPEIDMTANVLNGELIGGGGINITRSSGEGTPPSYNFTYSFNVVPGRGIAVTNNKVVASIGKGLAFDNPNSDSGVIQTNIDTNKGLKFSDDTNQATIQVNVKSDGGLTVDGNGVSVDLADSNSGLEIETGTTGGLKVDTSHLAGAGLIADTTNNKLKVDTEALAGDGLSGSSNTLSVNAGMGLTIDGDILKTNISAGSGIVITQNNSTNSITITNAGNTETGFIELKYGTDFTATGYNGFYNDTVNNTNVMIPKVSVRLYLEKNNINHFTPNAFYKTGSITQNNYSNQIVTETDWNNQTDKTKFYKITKCDLHIAGTYKYQDDNKVSHTRVLHNTDFIDGTFRFNHALDLPAWHQVYNENGQAVSQSGNDTSQYEWESQTNLKYKMTQNSSRTWNTDTDYMKISYGKYEPVTSKPDNWDNNYQNYYIFTTPNETRQSYHSYIFGIKFNGQFAFLNSGVKNYNGGFYAANMSAVRSSSGLWNVTTVPAFVRASWYATYSINRPGVPAGSESLGYKPGQPQPKSDGKCLFVISASYADGFNRQFYVYQHPSAGGATVVNGVGNQLNMSSESVQAEFTNIKYPLN